MHQVNCQRVMGAGLARQIRTKYPQHYIDYLNHEQKLGETVITKVTETLYIGGIFGQKFYGRGIRYTDYAALEKGLTRAAAFADAQRLVLYIPYGIGCGLAGGDWKTVSEIIDRAAPHAVVIKLD